MTADSQLLAALLACELTRIPLYRGDIDNIEGLLHQRHICRIVTDGKLERRALMRVMEEPYFVP